MKRIYKHRILSVLCALVLMMSMFGGATSTSHAASSAEIGKAVFSNPGIDLTKAVRMEFDATISDNNGATLPEFGVELASAGGTAGTSFTLGVTNKKTSVVIDMGTLTADPGFDIATITSLRFLRDDALPVGVRIVIDNVKFVYYDEMDIDLVTPVKDVNKLNSFALRGDASSEFAHYIDTYKNNPIDLAAWNQLEFDLKIQTFSIDIINERTEFRLKIQSEKGAGDNGFLYDLNVVFSDTGEFSGKIDIPKTIPNPMTNDLGDWGNIPGLLNVTISPPIDMTKMIAFIFVCEIPGGPGASIPDGCKATVTNLRLTKYTDLPIKGLFMDENTRSALGIINRPITGEKEAVAGNPQTSDSNKVGSWLLLALISSSVLAGTMVIGRKRKVTR